MALAPKKSVAIQARRRPLANITPISGRSGASVTASLAGQASSMVAPMPSMGQADVGAQRTPSEVAKEPVRDAVPLPMMGRTELPTTLVAPTPAGMTQPNEAPPMQAEVVVAMTGGS